MNLFTRRKCNGGGRRVRSKKDPELVKKNRLKRRKQEDKTKIMILNDIPGWRKEVREKNFNKILVKALRRGMKTIIVQDYEWGPIKYNILKEVKKRKLL